MWSLSELTQAVVIICHVHALSIFLASCKLYSVDATSALFAPTDTPTDKASVPDCPPSHLLNNLVSFTGSILHLRSVHVWLDFIFLKLRAFLCSVKLVVIRWRAVHVVLRAVFIRYV